MKIKRLYNPEDFTVNQMYMFFNYNRLQRGFCTIITEKDVTFTYKGNKTILKYKDWDGKRNYFAEYNSSVFYKYQKLIEYHKQEINDLLESNICRRDKDILPDKPQKVKKQQFDKDLIFRSVIMLLCIMGLYFIFNSL